MLKKISLFILAFLIGSTFLAGPVCAITLFEGKCYVTGYVQNDTVFRLRDGGQSLHGPDPAVGPQDGLDSGDLYLFRNTFQLEATWDFLDNLTLFGIYRGVYDGAMDLNSDYEDNIKDAGASHRRDNLKKENEIRELYVDLDVGNWRFRVGKQQWMWGEADGLRMADIINPLERVKSLT